MLTREEKNLIITILIEKQGDWLVYKRKAQEYAEKVELVGKQIDDLETIRDRWMQEG